MRLLAVLLCAAHLGTLPTPLSAQDAGKKYAFCVGVNAYENRGFADLQYAEADAKAMAAELKKDGFEVVLLTAGDAGAPANKARIEAGLEAILKKTTKRDTLIVALSGHGLQFEVERVETNGEKKVREEAFFCPKDAKSGVANSMVSISRMVEEIDAKGAGTNLLLVDACRDDPSPTRGSRGLDGMRADGLREGTAIVLSCSKGQRAFESANAGGGHGLFFHFVLEGLRGKAAGADKDITCQRLITYVTEAVESEAAILLKDESARQVPHLIGNLAGRRLLVKGGGLKESTSANAGGGERKGAGGDALTLYLDAGKTVKLELVKVDPKAQRDRGTFMMGSSASEQAAVVAKYYEGKRPTWMDGENEHEVTLTKAYYVGKYHVTRGQFRAFVESEGYRTEAETDENGGRGFNADTVKYVSDKKYNWRNVGFEQSDDHPVVNVSWNDAKAFCAWLSKKSGRQIGLPTEAEWEYACRAGSKTRYYFGDDEEEMARYGNISDGTAKEKFPKWKGIAAKDGYVFTSPSGKYKPNGFGLYDMHGNAWQWCEDYYEKYASGSVTNPKGPDSGSIRVRRGGSWGLGPGGCRSAFRYGFSPDYRDFNMGFRVAGPVGE